MHRRSRHGNSIPFDLDYPVPVAFGTFVQSSDDDFSTHEAGSALGTTGNVQLGS